MLDHKFKIRSKKLTQGAKGQSCIRCDRNDGTIVPAHYTGIRSHLFGKGTGTKCHDLCIADLCLTCHNYFDIPNPPPVKGQPFETQTILLAWKNEMSEEFLTLCMLTMIRRVKQGLLYTDDIKRG